jgi:glycosyltransferase involved in cell wall biosynthesis
MKSVSPLEGGACASKRIVLVCQHFYPEMVSTGIHMTELTTRLTELGWDVTVYCAKPSWGAEADERQPVDKEIVYEGVRVRRVWTVGRHRGSLVSRGIFAVSFMFAVAGRLLADRGGYDGLVITTNPPFLGVLGWFLARLLKKPYMLIVYDVYPDIAIKLGILSPRSLLTRGWALATRLMLGGASVLVVIGRDMAEIVRKKVPRNFRGNLVLIPNWSDERHVRPVPSAQNPFREQHQLDHHFVVQYAGRLGRTHNVESLLDAARLLSNTNVVFQFIGDGWKKDRLESLASELGLDNVRFLPYQPMDCLPQMLSAADLAVVCLESAFSGLSVPSKAYGVMAAGTPILGLLDPDSEIGRVINETGCGVTLTDPDGNRIAAFIRDLMVDPTKRSSMGEAGRQAFLGRYTLAHAAQAYDAALSAMLGSPRTVRGAGW